MAGLSKKPTYISLFTGAGGLDIGLDCAGFQKLLSIELDPVCQETLRKNNPRVKIASQGDIHKLSSLQIARQAKIKKGKLDLLVGGPPCQPFSKSGYWANSESNRMKDPRAATLREYLRVVNDLLPKNFIIENVIGIAHADKDDGLRFVKSEIKRINKNNLTNYQVAIIKINVADYGVPQLRERIFIVANRKGAIFKIPDPTHQEINCEASNLSPYTTAWDAIGDLDYDISPADLKVQGKWADLLPSIPEGHNYLWHTDRMNGKPLFGWRTRYWSFLLKLAKDKPSWTLTANPGPAIGPFHWKNRKLSIREMARIQTFPDGYVFMGSYREQQRQVGNAVPPAIGELFGLEIRRQFFNKKVRKNLKLVPQKKLLNAFPERRRKVPKAYLNLVGSYKDHPGVGKGPGAYKNN